MTNAANIVSITGRLTRDPQFFNNADGSMKVKATIAVQDNFKSGPDKKRQSQFIPVEQFLSVNMGKGAWANVTKGSQLQVLAHLESNNYEKNGETVYGLIVAVDSVNYLETRAETAARRAANAGAQAPAAGDGAAPAAPAPDAAETPFGA